MRVPKHRPDHLPYPLLPLFEDWRVSNIQSGNGADLYDCESTIETLKSLGMDYSQVLEKPGQILIKGSAKNNIPFFMILRGSDAFMPFGYTSRLAASLIAIKASLPQAPFKTRLPFVKQCHKNN